MAAELKRCPKCKRAWTDDPNALIGCDGTCNVGERSTRESSQDSSCDDNRGCPHGHIPHTCTACSEQRELDQLRARLADAEARVRELDAANEAGNDVLKRLRVDLVAARKLYEVERETLVKVWAALGVSDGGGKYVWELVEGLATRAGGR